MRTGTGADDGPVMGKSWAVMGNNPPKTAVSPGLMPGLTCVFVERTTGFEPATLTLAKKR